MGNYNCRRWGKVIDANQPENTELENLEKTRQTLPKRIKRLDGL